MEYTAISLFPSPVSGSTLDGSVRNELETAVRNLASDNAITAVMLTGIMFLQVRLFTCDEVESDEPSGWTILCQATLC